MQSISKARNVEPGMFALIAPDPEVLRVDYVIDQGHTITMAFTGTDNGIEYGEEDFDPDERVVVILPDDN